MDLNRRADQDRNEWPSYPTLPDEFVEAFRAGEAGCTGDVNGVHHYERACCERAGLDAALPLLKAAWQEEQAAAATAMRRGYGTDADQAEKG